MAKMIYGLDRFDLTPAQFSRLADRWASIIVHLRSWDVTSDVISRPPRVRLSYIRDRSNKWISQIRNRFPQCKFKSDPKEPAVPWSLQTRMSVKELKRLMVLPSVRSIYVSRIDGCRAKKKRKNPLYLYCVRARVAIQVENQTKGLQTIEDRFVLVRAESFKDAEKRLRKEWLEYATPSLNKFGYLVRWQVEEIVDVYDTCETELNLGGTEVYSKLTDRRMKPSYVWKPRANQNFR